MNRPLTKNLEDRTGDAGSITAAPSREKRRLRAYIALLLIDGVIILGCFSLAGFVYHGLLFHRNTLLMAQLLLPLYFTVALYNGSYSQAVLTDWKFAIRKALIALLIAAALLNFVMFYTKSTATFSRVIFSMGFMASISAICLVRYFAVRFVARHWAGKVSNLLVLSEDGREYGLQGATIIDPRELGVAPDPDDPFALDRLGSMLRNQDRVIVVCSRERRDQWAYVLKAAGVRGEIVSEMAHKIGAIGIERYAGNDWTTLIVSRGPLSLRDRAIKRAFDIVFSFAALVIFLPVILIAALAIKIEDGGNIFFIQRRLGRSNRFFNIFKLRTMAQAQSDHAGTQSTERDDPRITRVGNFLRSTSIDELPQLFNVLRGDMSIVGPRPHALGSTAGERLFWEVDARYWQRHSLRPGLTGLAQIRGHRGATAKERDLIDRVQSDLEYIENWSLLRDLMIIFRTLRVLRHDRAF